DADVGLDRFVAAQSLEASILKNAQDLRLRQRTHVADLVEEHGAAGDLLELADALAVRAGEGAFLVAEQLALQQVLGDGGAVDREEGLLRAPAVLVQGPRDQFLAGTAFAGDER